MQTARAEPIRYTYEDYLAFPDDGRRHELIDGEIEAVKVYRRQDDGSFPRVADLLREEGHSIDTPLLPGFSLSLAELFA